MKYIKLHSKTTSIVYKNSICSLAFGMVILATVMSIVIPVLLVSFLSPYSGISEVRLLFEQPTVTFQYKYIFMAENSLKPENSLLACSTFPYFNKIVKNTDVCQLTRFRFEDINHDGKMDKGQFQLNLMLDDDEELNKFYLVLFFKSKLKHKCSLSPPAVLIQELDVPKYILPNGEILIEGYLSLKQNHQFICPFYGRRIKSHFHNEILSQNTSNAEEFKIESIRKSIKMNPAYFELKLTEIYYKKLPTDGLKIKFDIDVIEVNGRYNLSIWERLGQFWLYFASFFGISFYICNKIKDFLFSRHIVRSWEIIPWKKFY